MLLTGIIQPLLDILLVYRFLIGIIQPFIFTYFIGYLIGIQNSKHITVLKSTRATDLLSYIEY